MYKGIRISFFLQVTGGFIGSYKSILKLSTFFSIKRFVGYKKLLSLRSDFSGSSLSVCWCLSLGWKINSKIFIFLFVIQK